MVPRGGALFHLAAHAPTLRGDDNFCRVAPRFLMIDAALLPTLVSAGVLGGFGWCWRAASRRSVQRHVSYSGAARAAGWHYEPTEHGFFLSGRTLTCDWALRCDAHSGARATLFSLGAPDERRAMVVLGTGSPARMLPHGRRWPQSSATLHDRVWIEVQTPEDMQRVVDEQVSQALEACVGRAGAVAQQSLRACLSPHGIEIACPHELRDWTEIESLIQLGILLGRRAGLA